MTFRRRQCALIFKMTLLLGGIGWERMQGDEGAGDPTSPINDGRADRAGGACPRIISDVVVS
jgi:hypothetical protein